MLLTFDEFNVVLAQNNFSYISKSPSEESYLGFDFSSTDEAKSFVEQCGSLEGASFSISDESYPDENEEPCDCWVVVTLSVTYNDVTKPTLEAITDFLNKLTR